jgi:hypothetical protein
MHLTDAEMGRITANNGVRVGSSTVGGVLIDGVATASTDTHARIVLDATKATRLVEFASFASSFHKGITVQAFGGIVLSQGFTTMASETILNAGTGTLTIMDMRTLSTTNQRLTITADDIDLQATPDVSTGGAALIIASSTNKNIGVGTTAYDMDIEADELQRLTSTGLTIGSLGVNEDIHVHSIKDNDSVGITGTVTLLATVDGSKITFGTLSSTFYGLAAQADDGIEVDVSLTTTASIMYLDGDYENSSSADTNLVNIADGKTLRSKTLLTLEWQGKHFKS